MSATSRTPAQGWNQEHLEQPVSDAEHQGLGAARDFGVGQEDLQSQWPAGTEGPQ